MNQREQPYPEAAALLKSLREHVLHYSDQEGAAKVVDDLLREIHELKRTRAEAEADATVRGYQNGRRDYRADLAAMGFMTVPPVTP